MDLLLVLAISSAFWGFFSLASAALGASSRPTVWRTVYFVSALVTGVAALGTVGIDAGWRSLWAGVGALHHLSAALVYVGRGLRYRR